MESLATCEVRSEVGNQTQGPQLELPMFYFTHAHAFVLRRWYRMPFITHPGAIHHVPSENQLEFGLCISREATLCGWWQDATYSYLLS